MDQAILEKEALRLPARKRALLADAPLGSLGDEGAREIEAAWGSEAEARLDAFHQGLISCMDGPQVLHGLRSRYSK